MRPAKVRKAPENSRNAKSDPESGGQEPVRSRFGKKFSVLEFSKVPRSLNGGFGGLPGQKQPASEARGENHGPIKQPSTSSEERTQRQGRQPGEADSGVGGDNIIHGFPGDSFRSQEGQ